MNRPEKENRARRARAMKVLKLYGEMTRDPHADHQTWLVDLLADLLHLQQARKGYAGISKRYLNINRALESAEGHYWAEKMNEKQAASSFDELV